MGLRFQNRRGGGGSRCVLFAGALWFLGYAIGRIGGLERSSSYSLG
jgi:hypothetical protein